MLSSLTPCLLHQMPDNKMGKVMRFMMLSPEERDSGSRDEL